MTLIIYIIFLLIYYYFCILTEDFNKGVLCPHTSFQKNTHVLRRILLFRGIVRFRVSGRVTYWVLLGFWVVCPDVLCGKLLCPATFNVVFDHFSKTKLGTETWFQRSGTCHTSFLGEYSYPLSCLTLYIIYLKILKYYFSWNHFANLLSTWCLYRNLPSFCSLLLSFFGLTFLLGFSSLSLRWLE